MVNRRKRSTMCGTAEGVCFANNYLGTLHTIGLTRGRAGDIGMRMMVLDPRWTKG